MATSAQKTTKVFPGKFGQALLIKYKWTRNKNILSARPNVPEKIG
jgi:hypothetical protein